MNATVVTVSPQDPEDVIGRFPEWGAEEVAAAVARGREAQREWRFTPAAQRADALDRAAAALERAADELVALGVREVGKPVAEMRGEVARAVAILRYYAQAALDPDGETLPSPDGRSLLLAKRRPHGVVGLITPWNFPVAIPVWKLAPALAYGNAVVLKPAPDASAVAAALGELLAGALPEALVQVASGGAAAGAALLEQTDALSFTGSSAVGHAIAQDAARLGRPFQGEMGGLNPSIVLADADLPRAAATIAGAAMGFAGQKCTATSRVIVVGDPGPFSDALVAAVERLSIGDPAEGETVIGPVITEAARQRVLGAVDQARAAGARVLTGGRVVEERSGYFVAPTLVDRIGPEASLAREEIFGPVAAVIAVESEDQALAVANDTSYGLAGAVFTADIDRALRFVEELEVGLVRVNGATSGVDFYAPFGGAKGSSLGPREQGKSARDFYTWTQTITLGGRR